ncbi:acetyl-CoA C-acyltransferase [Nocardioides sp.]|uniref:thiolase family protein n=1 Tax=Nocardioides sp. TaxID=35761 RepID=UPI0035155CE1
MAGPEELPLPVLTLLRLSGSARREQRPLVVLGGPETSAVRDLALPVAELLGDAVDLVAWDHPGRGYNTARPETPPTDADLAAGLWRVLAEVRAGRSPVWVLGTGRGGAVAAALAAGHPDVVAVPLADDSPRGVTGAVRTAVLGEETAPLAAPAVRPDRGQRREALLLAGVRTPFGRFNGALAGQRPDDLAATALDAVVRRVPGLEPAQVDDVVWGCANQAGEDNRNVGRMAVLLAGWPTAVPATTVNRLCGSSLDAAIHGARAVESGDAAVVVVGGVESMTRAPWVLPKPARGFPAGDVTAVSTALGWRLVNPRMPQEWTVALGPATEVLGERYGISRARQDAFALRSHERAHAAWEAGFYDDLVVPVPGVDLARDEGVRPDVDLDRLARLAPAFTPSGTITAGNASPLSDGAAAVVLADADAAARLGAAPLARIAGRAVVGVDPPDFGFAPVLAADRALARSGIGWDRVGAVELNEAFAVQALACVDAWLARGLRDPALVNDRGGAIALGHPLGASGARLLATLAARLQASGERFGVAAICIGVGQGLAVVLERL